MVWSGALVLLVGAIVAFAAGGDLGAAGARTAGALAMVLGGALLIAGILRLNRRRRARPVRYQDAVYRTSKGKIVAMVLVVIYILSPIDLIPDVFLPVGIIDDATAFTWLLFAIGQEVSRRRRRAI